jgi:hypothetical protein
VNFLHSARMNSAIWEEAQWIAPNYVFSELEAPCESTLFVTVTDDTADSPRSSWTTTALTDIMPNTPSSSYTQTSSTSIPIEGRSKQSSVASPRAKGSSLQPVPLSPPAQSGENWPNTPKRDRRRSSINIAASPDIQTPQTLIWFPASAIPANANDSSRNEVLKGTSVKSQQGVGAKVKLSTVRVATKADENTESQSSRQFTELGAVIQRIVPGSAPPKSKDLGEGKRGCSELLKTAPSEGSGVAGKGGVVRGDSWQKVGGQNKKGKK